MSALAGDWAEALDEEFKKPYYKKLYETVRDEYRSTKVFPPSSELFNAMHLTPLHEIKAVILGQDPYHNDGQAHGLCFSVRKGVDIPPSLVNIYKELHDDLGIKIPDHGDLTKWAEEGVLLLNTVLTVRAHQPNSHQHIGWLTFTDAVIRKVAEEDRPIVFMLWGAPAQRKAELVHNPKHLVLRAPHPSPLSAYRGFFGCRHFSKANEFLKANGVEPIDWDPDRLG
ncbi:MAG: uracil-DNA glycosylase [Lachnospiraceae bacterium]|nr:uracil-DNA glycosylase [Lachnospiraceae bacterium]